MNPSKEKLLEILEKAKTIAIVGASNKETSASYHVMQFLMEKGYTIYPIHPKDEEVLGIKAYKSVLDLPVKPDIIDVFRKSSAVPELVKTLLPVKPKCIWLQMGIESEEAAEMLQGTDTVYISDLCILQAYIELIGE